MQNDDEKSLKQRQLEQVGSKGARAAADLATGGAYEKVRNVPVVGNVAKGVENTVGKAAGSLDKLNQRRINLPSRMGNINNNGDGDNTNPDNNLGNDGLPRDEGLGNNEPLIEKTQDAENEEKKDKKKDGNFFGDKSSDDNSPFNFDGIKKAVKAYKAIKVGMILAPIFLIFIMIIMGFAMVFGPINSAIEYIKNGWDAIVSFFTPDQRELEEKYYSELARVQNVFESNQSVCVDINLITSTLTIGNLYFGNDYNNDRLLNDGNTEAEYKSVEESQSDKNYEGSSSNNIEYSNKMSEQIVLLAAMQTKHKKYSLDSKAASYCKNAEEEVLVDSSNQDSFSKDLLGWLKGNPTNIDSTSPQLVASNDNSGIFTYSVPKAVREQNFEYYIYYPPFDSDGSCSKSYAEKKLKEKNENNSSELSIGTDGDFTESIYYWNLVDDFIPDYYDDYLPSEEPARTEAILDLADQIFLVYRQMGNGQTCAIKQSYICRSDEGSSFYGGGQNLTRKEFLTNISSVAISEMSRVGIAASVTMAQAALESANGSSGLSTKYSNYYGMTSGCISNKTYPPSQYQGQVLKSGESFNKCTGNSFWDGTVVAMCNKAGKDCQWYRVYDSFENSTKDHSRLLTTSRYATCNTYSDYLGQIQCIKNAGYAEDADYVAKVSDIVKTYNLEQYDIGHFSGTIQENSGITYVNRTCTSISSDVYTGGASGDWASWKQFGESWSSLYIGSKTIKQVGCLLTSIAIQIARSGVPTTLGASFNPGTFMEAHKANGGFNNNLLATWDVTKIAPTFKYYGKVNYTSPSQIASYINQGYYIILNIHHPGEHHLAVDRIEGNKIYMFDPGSRGTEVFTTYNKSLRIDSFSLYKVG